MALANMNKELSCSVCFKGCQDPVKFLCGHNLCSSCIGKVLDSPERSDFISCPQCRTKFVQRSIQHRNIAGPLQPNNPEQERSGILCNYCINPSEPAVKTCVHCEASLCEGHVRVHNKAAEHVLIEPTACLENRKCHIHKKILEYYCNEDSVCICVSCRLDGEHKGHQVESMNCASEKKKEALKSNIEELSKQKIQAKSDIQILLEHEDKMNMGTLRVKRIVNNVFTELREKLDALEQRIIHDIYLQESLISNSVSDLIQLLEKKVDKLSKNLMKAEKIWNITDPLKVLQEPRQDDDAKTEKHEELGVRHFHQEEIFVSLLHGLSHIMSNVKIDMFAQICTDIELDRDTAGKGIHISEDLKTVSYTDKLINYPENPARFGNDQVLSKTVFSSGRHYWEVEMGKTGSWRLGVAYSSIDRDQRIIGDNEKSWCLQFLGDHLSVLHDDMVIRVATMDYRSSFGVYLDLECGRLSFYALDNPVRHLHTFITYFTEPLHAAFLLKRSFARIKDLS